jgi:hypothetical protein
VETARCTQPLQMEMHWLWERLSRLELMCNNATGVKIDE